MIANDDIEAFKEYNPSELHDRVYDAVANSTLNIVTESTKGDLLKVMQLMTLYGHLLTTDELMDILCL